jgi:hypothetical protein
MCSLTTEVLTSAISARSVDDERMQRVGVLPHAQQEVLFTRDDEDAD